MGLRARPEPRGPRRRAAGAVARSTHYSTGSDVDTRNWADVTWLRWATACCRSRRPPSRREHHHGPESDPPGCGVLVPVAGSGFSRRPQPCVQLVAPVATLARCAHHDAPSLPGVVVLSVRARPDIRCLVDPVRLGPPVHRQPRTHRPPPHRRHHPGPAAALLGLGRHPRPVRSHLGRRRRRNPAATGPQLADLPALHPGWGPRHR